MTDTKTIIPPTSTNISVPAFSQAVTLSSLQAQKVMRRSFTRAAGSLYRIDVILRIVGSEESAAEVEEIIKSQLSEVESSLADAKERHRVVLEENGIDELPIYDGATEQQVHITSPHVARFLGLIRQLDTLVAQIDAMWLSGLLTNKERNDNVYTWQQRIIGLGSRIIGIERRARLAAKRQGKAEEVDAEAPVTEAELAAEGDDAESAEGKKPAKTKRAAKAAPADSPPASEPPQEAEPLAATA